MVCVSLAPTSTAQKIARKNEKKSESSMKAGENKGGRKTNGRQEVAYVEKQNLQMKRVAML
jgi:hypothetical protein